MRIWSWQHVSVICSEFITELSPVYCCLVFWILQSNWSEDVPVTLSDLRVFFRIFLHTKMRWWPFCFRSQQYFSGFPENFSRVCGQNWNPILWRWCCWRTHNGHRNNCTCIRGGEMQWNALNGSWWSSVPFKWHFIRQPKSQLQGDLTKKLSHGTSQGLFNSSLSTEVCTVG